MRIKKTYLPNDIIRLADDMGNVALWSKYGENARILGMPQSAELLKAVETDAYNSRKDVICFDFPNELSSIVSELENQGYEIKNSVKILSVNAKELFASRGVEKSIGVSFSSVEYVPLRDLLLYQVEEMMEFLLEMKISLGPADIARFDDDMSCVVYDEDSRIKSVILASTYGNEILIELLVGAEKNNPQYIMAAMQGFAKEFLSIRLSEVYDRIAMLEVNGSISPLVKRLLDKEYVLDDSKYVVSAKKKLTGGDDDIEFEELINDPYLTIPDSFPYQENINLKMQWKQDYGT
ncbi:MAG: hypothetical protein J5959_06085 [Butyrivibrio sp.]|nr:hypothetical protein [Butyrivibrio sp.]